MLELFVAPLAWAGQKAADVFIGRLAEKGADRLVDRFDDRRRKTVVVPEPPDAPPRHRLGDVTSDIDIVVRHLPSSGQRVLLTFQATPLAGERTSGVIVPMLLGEAAHLTLPRGDYLIGALVLDPPPNSGGKPVLRGVGGVRHWVASNRTEQLTIRTAAPTPDLLGQLGLLRPDGAGPFQIAPQKPVTAPRQLPEVPGIQARLDAAAKVGAHAKALAQAASAGEAQRCRAATADLGPRCTVRAGANGLCPFHSAALKLGETLYDWSSGKPIA
ncbi:hypothetical protein SAMN05421837_108219 [Amycolatopsis pretoriensis]|uniref:Uncharacterized protein n=1 Tax=Amycolatopsis pretoriensis TaxID=218821 RepID=A0A1H5RDP5_9PSEU|nr:hypothetical protein [Amycolatopsis pretoriensis]SEF35627.1 hypothetical protein SAMN05421837_108219 [Amycolatopsis pretoriensis]